MDPDTIASRGNYHAHEHIGRTHESLFFSQASTRHERLSALQPVQASFWTLRGTAAGTATVDKRLESSRSTTSDELDAPEGSTLVRTAVCSKPTPNRLNDAHFRQWHLGSPVREICTPGSAWGDEIKWPCLLGERCS